MKPEESFVGQPVRSLQTMLRTIAQVKPAMYVPEADGVYSRRTSDAVAEFQRRNGLNPTGVADQQTWERIVREYEPARVETEKAHPLQITLNPGQVIGPGEEHHLVMLVQTMLITLGLLLEGIPEVSHTGVLDPETERAILAFQLQSGLKPTGKIDKQTWKALALQYALVSDELSRQLEEDASNR